MVASMVADAVVRKKQFQLDFSMHSARYGAHADAMHVRFDGGDMQNRMARRGGLAKPAAAFGTWERGSSQVVLSVIRVPLDGWPNYCRYVYDWLVRCWSTMRSVRKMSICI